MPRLPQGIFVARFSVVIARFSIVAVVSLLSRGRLGQDTGQIWWDAVSILFFFCGWRGKGGEKVGGLDGPRGWELCHRSLSSEFRRRFGIRIAGISVRTRDCKGGRRECTWLTVPFMQAGRRHWHLGWESVRGRHTAKRRIRSSCMV